jgi:hypothetical protein
MTRAAPFIFLLPLTHGCGYTSHDDVDAAAVADAGASDPCRIDWRDDTPIARSRTRYVEPVITGDHDGFLFVTTARAPDTCELGPCVVVERLPSNGAGSEIAMTPLRASGDRISLFAGTDSAGAGHFGAALQLRADELTWGEAPPWRDDPRRLALDPSQGLGALAFDADSVWVLTHAWMHEDTVGEGYEYPIIPRIVRAARDGATAIEPGPDPTEGLLFVTPALVLANGGAWLVATGFYGGPLRAAGPGWSGVIRERAGSGRYAVASDGDAIVLADTFDGTIAIERIDASGGRDEGAIAIAPAGWNVALARGGRRFAVAHHSSEGVRVTVLDASLAILATSLVPGTAGLDEYAVLGVAAADDGTFAVLVAPFPQSSDHEVAEPVELRRFRACD